MKISFDHQNIPETEKSHIERNHAERNHAVHGKHASAAAVMSGAVYSGNNQNWGNTGRVEKGKSLIEIQRAAENANVDVQQNYMTLMSHTMSEEDYAKLEEEGFDFGSMDPEKAVTIVDKIKAELARSGKEIKGYTDDLDIETLAAALGSQVLANAVVESFQEADIPLTRENLEMVSRAWDMASQLESMDDGSSRYMIDNELETEIWNLYLAQNSGAGAVSGNGPEFYAEDVQGYYTRNAKVEQSGELTEQIDRVITGSGREVNEKNRQNAQWLLENNLPLTDENLDRLEELQAVQLPVTAEDFAQAVANAVADGKDPIHANLGGNSENLYDKAARLAEYYQSDEAWENLAGDLTARRQLEEIRLRMTAEVNIKLIKSGFSIDTAPMEELVEALKQAERELAEQYFPEDAQAVEKYRSYTAANQVIAELPGLPAQVIGTFVEGQSTATLEEFHSEGKAIQDTYDRAVDSYETLMTSPRADMGDSIRKAFANVDDILRDLGLELTEETRRAARILGYNRMAMTQENLERVMEADRQVKSIIEKLTPAATLKMIRDGVNPLEKSFAELEDYFDKLPEEYKKEAESYSRFLYGLEQNKGITEAERDSYIGVYRLVRQIEKSDGAVIGALVNTQAELHFSNLLSAVRSGKVKSVDVKVADELGTVAELVRKGETISEQIGKAFVQDVKDVLTNVSYSEESEASYRREEMAQLREAVAAADSECTAMLQRGELAPSADNLLAAQALAVGTDNLFASVKGAGAVRKGLIGSTDDKMTNASDTTDASGISGTSGSSDVSGVISQSVSDIETSEDRQASEVSDISGSRLWEALDEKETFVQEYESLTEAARDAVEEASFTEAGASLDVKGMQLVHKQLTVAGALAKQEEYFIPMYIDGIVTRVHLTLERGSSEKGTVSIGIQMSEGNRLAATFHLAKGVLSGIFTVQDQNEVMNLQKLADTFREEAGEHWTVGDIKVAASGTPAETDKEIAEPRSAENAELYRVAKVFLQAVQKRGI